MSYYVYKRFEHQLWTAGHYAPDGKWHPESDHDTADDAAWRVHWLNGGSTVRDFGFEQPAPQEHQEGESR